MIFRKKVGPLSFYAQFTFSGLSTLCYKVELVFIFKGQSVQIFGFTFKYIEIRKIYIEYRPAKAFAFIYVTCIILFTVYESGVLVLEVNDIREPKNQRSSM